MKKIKKGDEVIVIAGKDKGKKGIILAVLHDGAKVLVDGVNLAKKHTKANPNANVAGGIITKPMPIDRSNVMVFDANSQKGSRIGIRILKDGQRVRVLKASDQQIDDKK